MEDTDDEEALMVTGELVASNVLNACVCVCVCVCARARACVCVKANCKNDIG